MSFGERISRICLAGLLAGFLVLGVGGRVAMRLAAYTTPEPPELTLAGTLQVILAGTIWGGVTAPLLLSLGGLRSAARWSVGPALGLLTLGLAVLAVASLAGFGGRIVAPPAFIVLSAALFPGLFVLHGIVVDRLATRWQVIDDDTSANPAARRVTPSDKR